MNRIVFVLGIIAILSLAVCCTAKESGVLLGLRSVAPDQAPVYRTMWIAPENDIMKLIATGEDLFVPRSTGFWKIGIARQEDEQWGEDFPWAVPVGQEVVIPDLEYDEFCEGTEWATILFIGNDYISFDRESGGYCEGAAHPWAVNWLEVLSIDDLQGDAGCVSLSTCIGQQGDDVLFSSAEQYLEGLSEEEREMLEEEPSTCSWGLIRRGGRWVLRGRLRYSAEVYRGHYADFDISAVPPKSLVSHDKLHPSWETVKDAVPGAIDAFCSPGKDILVVLTKQKLTIHHVSGNDIEKPCLSLALKDNEAAVMIQWAQGKYVQRWTDRILEFLDTP